MSYPANSARRRLRVDVDALDVDPVQVVEVLVRGQERCAGRLRRGGNPVVILPLLLSAALAEMCNISVGGENVLMVDIHPRELPQQIAELGQLLISPSQFLAELQGFATVTTEIRGLNGWSSNWY